MTPIPRAAPIIASAIPVFPEVASRSRFPGPRAPLASATRTIPRAARSFTLPPGLSHSAFAYTVTSGTSRVTRRSGRRGVFPIREAMSAGAFVGVRDVIRFSPCGGCGAGRVRGRPYAKTSNTFRRPAARRSTSSGVLYT